MLPLPHIAEPAEPFATPWPETECDQHEQPGVVMFRDFVLEAFGGRPGGRILGPCGGVSGHGSGRAWDWIVHTSVPEEAQAAEELLDWLLAEGAAMFRRVGLRYIIWDRRMWTSARRQWEPYDGFDEAGACARPPCRNPHTDHMHFSFGKDGAAGETSFYRWLAAGAPPDLPIESRPAPAPAVGPMMLAFAVGFGGVLVWRARAARRTGRLGGLLW
jgi:hypothetical protein